MQHLSEANGEEQRPEWFQMLKKMLGEEAAEDAFQQLQASGIDPEKLAGGAMPFPFPGGSGFGASFLPPAKRP